MSDKDKKKSKKSFDTTTSLELADTFDDEDVTLKERMPEFDDDEPSVTVDLKPKISNVPNSPVEENIKRVVDKSEVQQKKEILSDLMREFRKLGNNVSKKTLMWASAAMVFFVLLFLGILIVNKTTGSNPKSPKVKVVGIGVKQNLSLSPLRFFTAMDQELESGKVKLGQMLNMEFDILKSQTHVDQSFHINVDVRVYSPKGQLLVFMPDLLKFSDNVDWNDEKVVIRTRYQLHKDMEAGRYRILLTIKDKASGAERNVATRINITEN